MTPLDSLKRLYDNRVRGQPTAEGLPIRKETMTRHTRLGRAGEPARTKREEGRPSILAKVRQAGVAAVVTYLLALFEVAARQSVFQTLRGRWAIAAASLLLLFTVGLTVAFALRQRRRTPPLTGKVTAAYRRALAGSIINPEVKAESRG